MAFEYRAQSEVTVQIVCFPHFGGAAGLPELI